MAETLVTEPSDRTQANFCKGSLELADEAVHLLRTCSFNNLLCYYIGSLPFILGLLYFLTDMARSAYAGAYCAKASLGLAALFIWMKCWQAIFVQRLRGVINMKPLPPWNLRRILRLVTNQSFTHALGFILLPVSLITMVPFAWAYAFFQNVLVIDDREDKGIRALFAESWTRASLWPAQNHLLLTILPLFSIFIFINLAAAVYLVPHLLDKLLGIESLFTLSGTSALNTTFLAVVCGFTYLCIDPLIKAVYMLRCFYGESLQSGEDLIAESRRLFQKGLSIGLALFFFSLAVPIHSHAANRSNHISKTPPTSEPVATVGKIERSIEKTLENREFSWRYPRSRQREKKKTRGLLAPLARWVSKGMETAFHAVADAIKWVLEWLRKLFPETKHPKPPEATDNTWMGWVQTLLFVLLGISTCVAAICLWRILRNKNRASTAVAGEPMTAMPDIRDENIDGSELPAERWLNLAREWIEKGSLRYAMRAIYLAILAHLAERGIIGLAGHKSNRDYKQELNRRAHDRPDVIGCFAANVAAFDRAWYGMHPVSQKGFERFVENQERIMAGV
jgi:hypothetical protein